jgi:hypothetical protein
MAKSGCDSLIYSRPIMYGRCGEDPSRKKRSIGKPRKRWLDDVENYLKKMGVKGYRNIARYRDAWKLITKEATVLHRLESQ